MSISQNQSGKDSPLVVPQSVRSDWRSFMTDQMHLPESDTRWGGMCESLQRSAHAFPGMFASAYAHMVATPVSERIHPLDAPDSAFIFVDDPNDSNRYGHIVGKWGDAKTPGQQDTIPVVTNDVNDTKVSYDYGNVTVCPLGWFPAHWGDAVQFATLWFGPKEIETVAPQPPETGAQDTERWVKAAIDRAEHVIDMMHRAAKDNDGKAHPNHEKAIRREIADQRQIIQDLRKLLP